ncbi:hypothetical protein L3Q82_005491 [Scortum barcoo]|uniref:Uncharacterized protein n=1 Tax=Scortum barcoo TaxID=214431 RepID=A0ACB8VAK5_9TELE|nr:hypothetical protein L3Q82_005491 [Scortum barcoo]
MATKARVTLENAYWVGDDIYAKVDGKPYLVDSGAEVSMTRRSLETKGHLKVQLANGTLEEMPFGIWKRITPFGQASSQSGETRATSPEQSHAETNWYKPVDVTETTEQKIQESDFSPKGKERLKQIIAQANVARFKNDCGDLGGKYVHTIEGGVHPPVRQYPLNPGAVEEMDKIVRELSALGIIREEPSPITNSPIQAVKKPESAGGGWRPVINFKALNRRTIANRASLINPQGALKTLQVKKYKSCIDLANGFFSLRLAKQSQGKTAFTHKGKAYVWQRLPQGYKNSPNVFQSAVMDVLKDLGATIYIDDVFIADDTEEEHLEKLQKVVKRLTEAATDQENLEKLKKAIQEAGRLEPRSLTARLVAEISCEDDDAMVRVNNEGGGMVHRFLRKGTIEGTKATNARWGRWEDILLDPDLELGPTLPTTKKQQTTEVTQEEPYEWVLYTDGSKKGLDNTAYWGYILKQNEKEKHRQKGRVPGSAQVGEVTAILEGLLELGKRKVKRARIITDSHYCAQALKEDLTIWEENGFEGAKGKAVAHQDLWKKIAELRLTMNLDVVHQKAHGKEGAHWRGNDEVDRYVQQRRIVFVGIEKWDKTPKGKVVPKGVRGGSGAGRT